MLKNYNKDSKRLEDGSISIDVRRSKRSDDVDSDESHRVKLHFTVNPSQK